MIYPGIRGKRLIGPRMLAASSVVLLAAMALPELTSAQSTNPKATEAGELLNLPIEQLMDVEVTSVAKKPQRLADAAAAVYVITQEDIRRSGMTSVPELLRMVPGLDVAQISGDIWAISSRGFNSRFSNKLLVLIDGRSVYTLTDAGVNWDVQNLILEDVERIEVIRGPGGTLWGANAVNGVINIITKNAADTQGGLVSASVGSNGEENLAFRYGVRLGGSTYLRLYGQGIDRAALRNGAGASFHDGSNLAQGGFQLDSTPSNVDTVMLQGEIYAGNSDNRLARPNWPPPSSDVADNTDRNRGGHILARWTRRLGGDSDMTLQAFYDRADRTRTLAEDESVTTYDVDFQHRFPLTKSHQLVWGLGFRSVAANFTNTSALAFIPPHRTIDIYSAFIQDEVALGKHVRLTLGSKFEDNSYTGFEYQPNILLLWTPGHDQTLWAAVSRAVRTPARTDRDLRANLAVIPGPTPVLLVLEGDPGVQSEAVLAFEAGYRGQVSRRLTLDVATYFNRYDKLIVLEPQTPVFETSPPPPHLLSALRFGNLMSGETYGVEVAATWQVTDHWRLSPSYSLFRAQMKVESGHADFGSAAGVQGSSPEHQFQIRSQLDLPHRVELDGSLYYVSSLRNPDVPSHTRLDLRLGWRLNPRVEFDLVGQNLLSARHPEFGNASDIPFPSEIPRNVYGHVVLRF